MAPGVTDAMTFSRMPISQMPFYTIHDTKTQVYKIKHANKNMALNITTLSKMLFSIMTPSITLKTHLSA